MKVGLILLAGGNGTRMGGAIPKQFLPLKNKPIAQYSLDVFDQVKEICQIVIVADSAYHSLFPGRTFAKPGLRRQDSVWNGLQALDSSIDMVCVHDAARPFISLELVQKIISEGMQTGAGTAAVPLKFSVKQADASGKVSMSLDRSQIWEIQTPQVMTKELLEKGFAIANAQNLTITDDVGLVELLDHPVQLVMGSYRNIKLTTQEDMVLAEVYSHGV